MLKVVVFGYGHLGRWHVDKVIALGKDKLSKLVAVVDPCLTTQNKLKEKGLDIPVFHSFEDCKVIYDVAIVVTPTSFHFDLCKKLIRNKKHVFCEKPMTSTYEQSLELQQLIEENKVKFQVGHSERFHQIWSTVKEKTEYFKDAPILRLERQAPFKGRATDVDVVQDLMIHDIDLMMYILDDKPFSVEAFGKKQRTDKWDFVRALFRFKSGAIATICVGRNHTQEIRNFEVTNEAGCIQVDLFKKELKEAKSSAMSDDTFVISSEYPASDHLLEEQRLFYKSIKENKKTVVNERDGLNAVYIVEQVLNSLETQKVISW